jgi:uncharacterized protein
MNTIISPANIENQMRVETLRAESLGHVVSCNGARAIISAVASSHDASYASRWSVGRLVSIDVGACRIVAMAVSMHTDNALWAANKDNSFKVEMELMGEVAPGPDGREFFSSGITNYPYVGCLANDIRPSDLNLIYDTSRADNCVVGKLSQNDTINAAIHLPSMLSKHFAIVGSTGVGKSTTVTLLLNKAIAADPNLRVLMLDPHNEFASAFPDTSVAIDTQSLDLPFWLMRLEEFVEVLYRGRPIHEEIEVLRDLIPEAKRLYRTEPSLARRSADKTNFTPDTPSPYRMTDLLALVDERIGRLEGRDEKPMLRALKLRLLAAIGDPNYSFMFGAKSIPDMISDPASAIFRIPGNGRPITTLQLSGVSSEVVNCLASILCRMAFETAASSHGAYRVLVVCEEAHRYIPADPSLGFAPSRAAIARIAKEGRKYGVSIGVITQRPGELDPTILSQCSTFFAMRLTNDRDKEIVRNAIPDSTSSIINFITSIGNGEAIAFGEALPIPMRVKFERMKASSLPSTQRNRQVTPDEDLSIAASRINRLAGASPLTNSGAPDDYSPRPQVAQASSDLNDSHLEPYRPDMLPGAGFAARASDPQSFSDRGTSSLLRKDTSRMGDIPIRR